jgi:hypothetical protein
MKTLFAALSLTTALLATLAAAAEAEAPFAAKTVAERVAALDALAPEFEKPENRMALATAATFAAVERFGQALYRHGFRTPRSSFVPLMRMPIPDNPNPDPLTYEAWRATLKRLVDDLEEAKHMLASLPDDSDFSLVVDLGEVRFDLDGDGELTDAESVLSIFQAFDGGGPRRQAAEGETAPPPVFRFDRADAYWLEGYANFLTANARLWLAHDFSKTFDTSFTLFFPRETSADAETREWSEAAILDFISLIHTIAWPVVEPETRKAILADMKEMTRLSRLNWQAIRAETDNDREWVPGPHQPGPHPLTSLEVTEEIVTGWHAALDAADAVLDGKALVPHMRYPGRGVNLKRYFEEGKDFDFVLTVTGPAVLPYLETGAVVDEGEWGRLTGAFGRTGITPFALWFN